jgi:hypothetical protein
MKLVKKNLASLCHDSMESMPDAAASNFKALSAASSSPTFKPEPPAAILGYQPALKPCKVLAPLEATPAAEISPAVVAMPVVGTT